MQPVDMVWLKVQFGPQVNVRVYSLFNLKWAIIRKYLYVSMLTINWNSAERFPKRENNRILSSHEHFDISMWGCL